MARNIQTTMPPEWGFSVRATPSIAKAKTACMATTQCQGVPPTAVTRRSSRRNTQGKANHAVLAVAKALLMPIRFSITSVTDKREASTMPRKKYNNGTQSHDLERRLTSFSVLSYGICTLIAYSLVFFPNSGSILINADTAKVIRHSTITMMKKVL